jgi:hypothetical protein
MTDSQGSLFQGGLVRMVARAGARMPTICEHWTATMPGRFWHRSLPRGWPQNRAIQTGWNSTIRTY